MLFIFAFTIGQAFLLGVTIYVLVPSLMLSLSLVAGGAYYAWTWPKATDVPGPEAREVRASDGVTIPGTTPVIR